MGDSSPASSPLLTPLLGADPDADYQRRKAPFLGSVFNLCAATLGAGVLSVPYAVSLTGCTFAIVLFTIAAGGTLLSIDSLVGALESTGCKSYEAVAAHIIGPRTAACVEVAIFAFCFGTLVAYQIALGDVLEVLLVESCGWIPDWAPRTRSQWMCAAWGLLLLPLSLPRSLAALQHASFLGTVALCVLVITVCLHSARRAYSHSTPIGAAPAAGTEPRENAIVSLASALSIIMFAFTSQVNVPEVFAELKDASPGRMRRVTACAVAIALTLYVTIGVAAFAEFGAGVKSDVLENYDIWGEDKRDRSMLPAFAFMAITITMAYPLNVFPARHTIFTACFVARTPLPSLAQSPTGTCMSSLQHVGTTVCLSGVALIVAVFAPGINVVFQLLGGTASALVCFCVPAALALRARLPTVHHLPGRLAVYTLLIGGALVGVVSTAVTVSEVVAGSSGSASGSAGNTNG